MSTRTLRSALAAAILLAGLVGCDSSESPASAELTGADSSSASKSRSASAQRPGGSPSDMVSAVSGSSTAGLVELKFSVRQRPQVNEVIDIDIAVVPRTALEQLFATFQVSDGLELQQGAEMPLAERPAAGTPLRHTISVIPQREGIFNITAVVLADTTSQSLARSYAIPIIVGAGIPPLAADDEVGQ